MTSIFVLKILKPILWQNCKPLKFKIVLLIFAKNQASAYEGWLLAKRSKQFWILKVYNICHKMKFNKNLVLEANFSLHSKCFFCNQKGPSMPIHALPWPFLPIHKLYQIPLLPFHAIPVDFKLKCKLTIKTIHNFQNRIFQIIPTQFHHYL